MVAPFAHLIQIQHPFLGAFEGMAPNTIILITASSDEQFFLTTRQGEAMKIINAKYGHEPGMKAYTHVSDRFGPFAARTIPRPSGRNAPSQLLRKFAPTPGSTSRQGTIAIKQPKGSTSGWQG